MWIDKLPEVVSAFATVFLAAFAALSAYYAYRLWEEAKSQFNELKRSTDADIALRMLQRCDDPAILLSENYIETCPVGSYLGSLDQYVQWHEKLADGPTRREFDKSANAVLHTYEHIGLVSKTSAKAREILTDYLCLRAPTMLLCLQWVIKLDKIRSTITHGEFVAFAKKCIEVLKAQDPRTADPIIRELRADL